jgi:hypothetical protein
MLEGIFLCVASFFVTKFLRSAMRQSAFHQKTKENCCLCRVQKKKINSSVVFPNCSEIGQLKLPSSSPLIISHEDKAEANQHIAMARRHLRSPVTSPTAGDQEGRAGCSAPGPQGKYCDLRYQRNQGAANLIRATM